MTRIKNINVFGFSNQSIADASGEQSCDQPVQDGDVAGSIESRIECGGECNP